MKMNKKIIVSTLALAMGAALAGSVSGTVAWFQYSTRAQAAFIGASAHCSEALEIQATAKDAAVSSTGWGTELTSAQVATATGITAGTAVAPITSGAMEANGALPETFYSNPIYQHFAYGQWVAASASNYYQFDLHFHVKDINNTSAYLAKALYLTDLSIVSLADDGTTVTNSSNDLYKAIRVHIACGTSYKLFANDGTSAATVTTSVGEYLDLNNDGKLDTTAAYEWGDAGTQTIYGASGSQTANNVGGFSFADDTTPSSITAGNGLIGNITAADDGLKVTVTMWIEGWQELSSQAPVAEGVSDTADDAQVWNPATYIGKKFGVGFRFACEAHVAH